MSALPTGKYVVVEHDEIEWAIIFPGSIQHDSAVNPKSKIVSAGFFSVEGGKVQVAGFSNSLNLQSRPKDSQIVKQSLFVAGLRSLFNA